MTTKDMTERELMRANDRRIIDVLAERARLMDSQSSDAEAAPYGRWDTELQALGYSANFVATLRSLLQREAVARTHAAAVDLKFVDHRVM